MNTSAVGGVLLDIDGTLLDSNVAHAQAWLEALSEAGIRTDLGRVRPLIGKGGDKVLPELAGVAEQSPEGKAISTRSKAIFKERYLESCHPFPMAREFVERARADGLVVVVATSASKSELDALLDAAHVRDLIQREATSSDAERSKPDPDIVQAAVSRSGLSAHRLLMLGDTPYDVEAARGAGVDTIALRSGGWNDAELSGAIAVYADVADLLARYASSPLRRGR